MAKFGFSVSLFWFWFGGVSICACVCCCCCVLFCLCTGGDWTQGTMHDRQMLCYDVNGPSKNCLNHNFKTLLLSKRHCPAQEHWTVFGGIKDCYRWERLLASLWAAAKHAGRHHTVQGAAGYRGGSADVKPCLCSCPMKGNRAFIWLDFNSACSVWCINDSRLCVWQRDYTKGES